MRKIAYLLAFLVAIPVCAIDRTKKQALPDSLTLHMKQYADSLQRLVDQYRMADSLAKVQSYQSKVNPYTFPLVSGGVLYNRPVQQSMGINWTPSGVQSSQGTNVGPAVSPDKQLVTLSTINEQLASMYIRHPGLFTQTQEEVSREGVLLTDVEKPIKSDVKMSDQIKLSDIENDVRDTIAAITRRPNFWTLKGSTSLQFTQSYFSDNWFQGGDKNYAALSLLTLEANFDNKQKLQWENKLEVQLGFQTTKGDSLHALKVTSNLLRFTTKLGYKAFKNWYYTAKFQTNTALYPNYKTNSEQVTTDFASPLYMGLSVGLDFKWNKKRFTGSLYMAPVEVNARYVDRKELRSRYNDNAEQATKWTWGPNVVVNYNWKIIDNITWQGRLYWFSNFHYTNVEWENTFTFNINKFLNCKLFIYPKFYDDNVRFKNEKGRYWMFKEWLSLGVSYSW